MTSSFISRVKMLSFLLVFFAVILVGKLFLVQIVHGSSYKEKANRQYATPSSDIFERGTIFFKTKDGELVSAATQTSGFKIAISPKDIVNPEDVYQKISVIIPQIDKVIFISKASKKDDPYEEIVGRLSKEEADAVSALKISGVSIYKEKWRFYPGGNMASNTIGLIGWKGDELAGRYGLERQYDSTLSRNKDNPYINFFAEVFSNISDSFFSGKDESGDIITTIEPSVQTFLDKKLEEISENYNPTSLGGIIINPKDGSIYAMALNPNFDPNNFSKVKNVAVFSDPLVEREYEFGSVIKPLVMASGLDAGVVTPDTTYDDKGFVILNTEKINNFDKKGRGVVSMQEVLNQSLNTGMVFVFEKLGREKMRNYMMAFGIGEKTGIDLPNETYGLVSNLYSGRDIEYATASFGQGIALTPIEAVRAFSALANGGNLVTPHLVDEIRYDSGISKKIEYKTVPTLITKKTSEDISRMLVTVMDKALKAGAAKMPRYTVAVKTGTAQMAKEDGRGYYEDRYVHSFFGYFPAYDPKFLVFLYAVDPKGIQYASQTWADPFLDITKFLLNYYQVPPDR